LVGAVFRAQPAIFQGATHCGQQLFAFKRLQKIVVSTVPDCGQSHGNIMHGRHHHNRHLGILFLGTLEETDTVHVGHHQIGED